MSPVPNLLSTFPPWVAGAVAKLMARPEGTLWTSGKEAILGLRAPNLTSLHELNSFKRITETVSSKVQCHTEGEILKSE